MDTKAKKKIIKIGVVSALAATVLGGALASPHFGVLTKNAKAEFQTIPAKAAQTQDTLITPTTYEQYLPLTSPTDVAVCDDFTAIADGNVIYVYNPYQNVYRTYVHNANTTPDLNSVANLEFSDAGDLYFIDGNAHMYAIESSSLLSTDAPIETKSDFPTFFCNAFVISGDDLYFAVSSEASAHLSRTSLSAPNASTAQPIVSNLTKGPAIAYYDETLYYTDSSGYFLKKIDLEEGATPRDVCAFSDAVSSIAVNGDEVFISNDKNNFYVYNRITLTGIASAITPIHASEGGYKTLSIHEEYVYAVREQSIRQYEVGVGFTDFEISADSTATHRLSGATTATLIGETLYTADGGNQRISIYDTAKKTYRTVETPSAATMVTAIGNHILAANDGTAWLIDLTDETNPTTQTFKGFQGNLIGLTAVHDTFYLATAQNVYYSIEYLPAPTEGEQPTAEYAWQLQYGIQKNNQITPRLFTSDVYGNFYIVAGNDVHKLREGDLFVPDAFGTEILSILPANPEQIHIDLNENIYVLKQGVIHRYAHDSATGEYTSTATEISLAAQMVYGQTDSTPVQAFAFNVLENAAYVLYNGNFVIKTARLELPTVKTVPTEKVQETIFSAGTSDFKVVETAENAFLIAFDLEQLGALQGVENAYFPYLSHGRETEKKTALYLCEVGEYSVLAIFNKTTHKYSNFLTKTRYFVTEKDASEYLKEYTADEEKTGYLTNALSLYKYPYLTSLLTVTGLTKNQAITLVGEVNDLDYSYYKIRFTDENGNEQTGFIPKSYATLFDGEPKPTETTVVGNATPNTDSLGRLLFLLLGTAAICILLDLLILHKPTDE